jgi:GTP-binding protein
VKILSVEFSGSVAEPGGARPADLPQVAFSGRSNVGKSSLINTLLQRTRHTIAHVSGKPGKTQTLNFYRVNDRFYLVDLPGSGYARVPRALRDGWRRLVEGYLSSAEGLRGVVHLVDARRGITDLDRQMIEYLAELGLPTLLVVTKVDKLGRQKRGAVIEAVVEELAVDLEQVVPFSSKTGEGREELLDALDLALGEGEEASP